VCRRVVLAGAAKSRAFCQRFDGNNWQRKCSVARYEKQYGGGRWPPARGPPVLCLSDINAHSLISLAIAVHKLMIYPGSY